jgi:hypothetical protein
MSWTDKELSEIAKKAEADQAFAYQDSFWAEMEALLPAKKKRIWPFFLSIAVPVIGATIFFLSSPKMEVETILAAKTPKFKLMNSFDSTHYKTINENFSHPDEEQIVENKTSNSAKGSTENSINQDEILKSGVSYQQKASTDRFEQIGRNSANGKIIKSEEIFRRKTPINKKEPGKSEIEKVDISEITMMSIKDKSQKMDVKINNSIDRIDIAQISTLGRQRELLPSILPYYSKRRFFSAYGELGFTIGETYSKNQIGHVQSVTFGAGGRLTKNKIFVQSGLGIEIEKVGLELSQREKKYNYGLETFENRMSYREMYRANLPVNIGYMFAKHTLQIGATASYLMSTKMKYTYLENESLKRDEMIYGEKTGWNTFGLKINAGYGFSILPSTTIGVNFQVQSINQLDKNWTNDENNLPISGQIFIRKTIR